MGASIKNLALLMLFAAAVVGLSAQTTHQVLGTLGWTIPSTGAAAYTAWAANQTFKVGDILVFTYTTGQHNVATVTKQAFDNCNATNPILLQSDGPTSISLNSTGEHYYICTFSSHCSLGQKLAVNVSATSGSAPSTPPPSGSTTPPPAPSSGTSLKATGLFTTVLSVALALLY